MKRDLVFVSLEDWDEIWRRNQFLCAELATRFPERKIVFVGRARNVGRTIREHRTRDLLQPQLQQVDGFSNIWFTQALRFGPERFTWGRILNERIARNHIRGVMRRLGIQQPLLWINPHYAGHLAGSVGEALIVYDITDDWALATLSEWERRLVELQDSDLCTVADLVIVCSEALAESRRERCRELFLLPNGVHVEHYQPARQTPTFRRWNTPVFGYVGTLHPDRIDVDLIEGVARAFSHGSLVLVGPDHLDDSSRKRLSDLPNVVLLGAVPYASVPLIIAEFDVCIVPHRQTAFTESLNPIKLWEFLACGKPIVASDVAGFRSYPHLCYIASCPDAFIAGCQSALLETGSQANERLDEAGRHTWSTRVDTLLERLAQLERAA